MDDENLTQILTDVLLHQDHAELLAHVACQIDLDADLATILTAGVPTEGIEPPTSASGGQRSVH